MAFDPDAFLLEEDEEEIIPQQPAQTLPSAGFDPDAFLAEEEPAYQYDPSGFRRKKPVSPEAQKEIGTLEGIANAARNAFDSSRQALDIVGDVTPEEAKNIAKIEFDKQSRKIAPGYDEYQKAEGFDAVLAFAKNPIEVTSNIVAEGLAGSLPALGAGLAAGGVGAAIGAPTVIGAPIGFTAGQVAGTFAGSLATEYGSKILEEMQEGGVDLTKPESIQGFFENEEAVSAARDKAISRGIPVAAFDAISAGIGGKLGRVIGKQFLTKTGEAAAELGVQAGLGGGGEVAGALVAGEPIEGKAVFGEIIGEAGPGAAEIITGRMADRAARVKAEEEKKIKAAAQLSDNLEQNSAPLTAAAVKSTTATTIEQDKLAAQLEEQLDADEIASQVSGQLAVTKEPTTAPPETTAQIADRLRKQKEEVETKSIRSDKIDRMVREDAILDELLGIDPESKESFSLTRREKEQRLNPQQRAEYSNKMQEFYAEKLGQVAAPTITPAVTPAVPTAQPPITDATQEIIQPEGVRQEPQDRVEVPPAQAGVGRGVFDTTRGQEEGQVVPTPEPIISEIPTTSELVGAEPTQPTIREVPEISPIVGAEPAAIVEQEPVAPAITEQEVDSEIAKTNREIASLESQRKAEALKDSPRKQVVYGFDDRIKESKERLKALNKQKDAFYYGKIQEQEVGLEDALQAEADKIAPRDATGPLSQAETITLNGLRLDEEMSGKLSRISQIAKDRLEARAAAPTTVTTPPVTEAVTPAPEAAPTPAGISVGNRIKLGKSPQTYTIEEVIPQSATERELREQYYSVKNERTGETQVVEARDLKQVKGKGARKIAAATRNEEYMRLAQNPEANREQLQRMVDEAYKNFYNPENYVKKSKSEQYVRKILAKINIIRAADNSREMDAAIRISKELGLTKPDFDRMGSFKLLPVTYDDAGNIIPLEERFQPTSLDIRRQAIDTTPEGILTTPPDQQYTFNEVFDVAYDMFGGEIPEGFTIVNDSTDKDFEFKAAYIPESGEIVVNLAYLNKSDDIRDTITHELGHYIFGDPEFRAAFDQFIASLSPEARAELDAYVDTAYNKETGEIRLEEKMVRAFVDQFISEEQAPAWRSMLDAIKRFLNKLGFKFNISDRDAISVFTAALDRYKAGEAISREGGARKIIDDLTAMDAEYLAAVERGDMETAQKMVDEAAKKAGYAIDSYHGTNGDLFTIFSTERGGDKTFAESARLGIFSTNNPDVAQTYAENIGAGGTFALGLGQGPLVEARDRAIATPEFKALSQAKDAAEKEYSATSKRIYDKYLEVEKAQLQSARGAFRSMLQNKTEAEIDQFIEEVAARNAIREFSADEAVNKEPELIAAQDKINEASRAINEYIYPFLLEALPNVRVMKLKLQIKNPKVYDAEGQTPADFSLSDKIQEAKDLGHDGVIFENIIDPQLPATHYVVFEPQQIKSADPVTYDDAGDVIPLSQRFRPTSPDIRRMAAEPAPKRRKEQVGGAEREETRYITTPKGILSMNTDVLREKFFDGTSVSPEKTTQAWGYISRLLDIKSGNANEFAGEINDTVDSDLVAKREAAIAAGEKIDPEEDVSKRIGAAMFSVELMNYAGKLAEQGDQRMLKFMIRNVNSMPTDKYAGDISDAARALRTRLEYDVSGFSAYTTEQKAKVDRTAAVMFGTNKPSKEQSDAVKDAIDESEKTELGNAGEVAGEVEKVEKRTKRKITDKIEKVIGKGSLKGMIQAVKDTPLEKQQERGWIEKVVNDFLINAGLSPEAASTASKLYESLIAERFAAAKQKAFEDNLKKAAPWKNYAARNSRLAKDALNKVQAAIRTGVLDPEKNTESIIAAESGWSGFTKDQYQRIVQLDSIINDPKQDDVTRREAMADLNKVISDAKLPVRFKDALGAYYVGNALMGIPTLTVNIASPIGFTVRNLMTDVSKFAFTDPARIPVAFETFMESMRSWYDQTSYAFKNQIYLNDVVEYLQGQNVLRELFDKGKKQWSEGKYAEGFVNMAVGMTQITGRVLSSLDQGAISMLENQNITRYALEALANTKGKVPKDKLKEFANMVIDTRRKTIAENIANGMSRDRAGVLADLAVKSEVISALAQYDVNPMNVLDASINDALQSVGRNKTLTIKGIEQSQKNISDEGFMSYWPIKLLEMVSAGAGREGSSMQIFAKMLYGFALVPARVFHNVAWFSPYGFIRLGVDKYKKNKGEDSPYAMSLQTEAQYKQRLTDAIAGSVAMLGLAALSSASTDEDEDKKFKIVITGNGPSATTDKQYFDSWMKKWKPYSVHIVVNGNIIPINIGRGGEALFFPIMLAGALDDWKIKQKQNLTKKEPEDLSAIAQMLGSSFFALAQRGPYAAFTKPLFDASKDGRVTEELASQAGFFGKTFIPVLGSSLARNISDLFNDPVDRSSIEGAIYANTPVVGPWLGTKALNALGQPIRADDWGDKLFKLGVPVVFSFPKETPMNELNELILKQGSGPTIPTRANAQKRFGDILTDKEFETYVREYGRVMSDKMFKSRTKLANMKPADYDDELEKYARGYSIDGIKIKGASDSAVLAVKRMRQ